MFDRREAPQFYPEVKMTVQKRERATIGGQQSVVSDTPIVIEAGFAASLIRARPSECSKLLRLPPPTQTACKRGASWTEADMNQFIRRRNVERYWRLLDNVSNESDRQQILQLLVDERQKQKDAGDVFIG
jgi:hypothetical protein